MKIVTPVLIEIDREILAAGKDDTTVELTLRFPAESTASGIGAPEKLPETSVLRLPEESDPTGKVSAPVRSDPVSFTVWAD